MQAIIPSPTPPSIPVAPILRPPPPARPRRRSLSLPLPALLNKVHLMAEAGAGKSRWLGRALTWQLFLYGIPTVVIDPTGGTVDNFFDKLMRLPRELQIRLWRRVLYVDMSGKGGYVVPFPLYYRLSSHDSLNDIAQRYLEVVERLDPYLKTASVMGLNAIVNLGTWSGMLLAALDCQITEAADLISHPGRWQRRFKTASSRSPDVKPAIEFFQEFGDLKPDVRARRSESFLTKIQPFLADKTMAAMFGASEPGILWDRVVDQRQVVLLDFRHELNANRKRFKLLWCFRFLVDYFKFRGVAGRRKPVALIIDEITQLLGFGQEQSIMAEDIEELVSVIARNYGVYLTIAHQNLAQLNSERIQKCLMTMGTQLVGVQTDPESAQLLAQYFHRYDPYLVKRYERVWMSDPLGPYVVDLRPIEFTIDEQTLLSSYEFMDLDKFEFMVRAPQQEGSLRAPLRKISMADLDRGLYPDEALVADARRQLAERDGRPVEEVLAEIEARRRIPTTRVLPQPETEDIVPESELVEVAAPEMWGG